MKLFVAGFPTTFEKEHLSALFEPFGRVLHAKVVLHHQTGKSRGFGFVEMENETDAKQAIRDLNKTVPNGFKFPLAVKKAQPKN